MPDLQKIREQVSNLTQLTPEQLEELRGLIVDAADALDAEPTTPENVAVLNELADAGEQVMTQAAALQEAQAQAEADKKAARERIARINGKADEPEDAGEGVDDGSEENTKPAPAKAKGDGDGEGEGSAAGAEGEPAAAGVQASGKPGTTIAKMAGRRPAPGSSPELQPPANRTVLVAAGDATGARSRGAAITDKFDLGAEMANILNRLDRRDKPHGRVLVASADWSDQYPDSRRFTDDAQHNAEIVAQATDPTSLLATGGICSPVNVDWSLGTWAVADRPLRDFLAAFQATRGGLTYRQPPTVASLAGATAVWTEATDLSPGASTKPVLQISCASPTTVYASAVSTRVGFGNMESRFDPETVAANTDLAIAAAARIAEVNLLTTIAGFAVGNVTDPAAGVVGAARDFVVALDKVRAVFKDLHRISDTQVLSIIMPRYLRDMIRADRAQEFAHDGSSVDPMTISDEYIESLLVDRHFNPCWTLDNLPSGTGYGTQVLGAFAASSAVPAFPTAIASHVFLEGSIQFLDGGRLDLGVVRDSTLDATNDYETFVETFEGVANRGFANGVIQMVSTLVVNGASAGTVTVTG